MNGRCQCYGVDCGGSIYDPAHPCMRFGPSVPTRLMDLGYEIGSEAWVKARIAAKLSPEEIDRPRG